MNGHQKPFRLALVSALLSLACVTSQAEDIDLFNVTPTTGTDNPKPNVLFVLDNSANWDAILMTDETGNKITKKDAIHAALYRLASNYNWSTQIRMGIMTLAQSNTPKGGRLLHAIGDLNSSAYSPDGIYRYNRYRLLDKIWGTGITVTKTDPSNPSKTITDTGVPLYQWWCNSWVDVDWNKYNKNVMWDGTTYTETGVGQENSDTDWVIRYDADGDGVDEAGDDCYIPAPFTIAYNAGYGNVSTDATTNAVYLDGTPTGAIWDYDYSKQVHYYLDPTDVDMVTSSSDPNYATYPYTYVSEPDLIYRSDTTDEITVTKLSDITTVGTGPRIPKTNNRPFALTMHEAYLYFNGENALSGLGDGWYDETTNKGADNWRWYDQKSGAYTSAFSGTQYISPVNDANACARNFIIFIGNGHPDASEDGPAETLLRAMNGVHATDPISLTPDNDESNWSDEYARFIYSRDFTDSQTEKQNALTYVIDVFNEDEIKTDVDLAARALLKNMAKEGHGRYFAAESADAIYKAMEQALLDIVADNSVFASTTLPVSVNVRGTNLNQVYMGVFRPDEMWGPRWMGNLKLYQLAADTTGLFLADANGNKAEDTANGFIVDQAESFWTFDEADDFWDFDYATYPNASDLPDGKQVEKGATAQRIRKDVIEHIAGGGSYDTSRSLYTCSDDTCGTVVAFNDSNAGTRLQVTSPDYTSSDLVDWLYGARNHITDGTVDEGTRAARASLHGDVLHSRPAVIGYNAADENDVIAYYGSNDGIFHAVKGGKTSSGSILDGHERWGIIFPEFLPKLKELYDNEQINTDPTDPTTYKPKPYFADGSIGTLIEADPATNNPTKVHLFISMRRGGRFLYALDVSPPAPGTLPTNFNILWKKSSADYPELGQTWSEPKVAKLKVNNTGNASLDYKKVLIFGGGYDPDFDDVYPRDMTKANQGRDIFILDAADGSLIWKASDHTANANNNFVQQYPIPSDVTVLDLDGDGDTDRLYVGDTGGNLWRVNIDDVTTPDDWAVDKLATVGADNKFLYPPDVVSLENGNFAVLIGSGNREDPRNKYMPVGHRDRFYMFEDTGSTTGLTETDLANVTAGDEVNLSAVDGWFVVLEEGEKVVSSAVTLNGVTFFNTSQVELASPTATPISCSGDLGNARAYHISYKDGSIPKTESSLFTDIEGGGLPPSPVAVIVEIDGKKYEAVVSGTAVLEPPGSNLEVRQRRYWFQNID